MFGKRSQTKRTNTSIDVTSTQLAAWRALASFVEVYKYQHFIEPDQLIMGPIDENDCRIVWFVQEHNRDLDQFISLSFRMHRRESYDGRVTWEVDDAVYGYQTYDEQRVGCKFEVLSIASSGFAPWTFAPPIEGEPDEEYMKYVRGSSSSDRGIYLRNMKPVPTGPRFPS